MEFTEKGTSHSGWKRQSITCIPSSTECSGGKFHTASLNSHRNCQIFMTDLNSIFNTIHIPYILQKLLFDEIMTMICKKRENVCSPLPNHSNPKIPTDLWIFIQFSKNKSSN